MPVDSMGPRADTPRSQLSQGRLRPGLSRSAQRADRGQIDGRSAAANGEHAPRRPPLSRRRKLRLLRTSLIAGLVLLAVFVLVSWATDPPRIASPLAGEEQTLAAFEPDDGAIGPLQLATPILEGEQLAAPRHTGAPISGEWVYDILVERGLKDGDTFMSTVTSTLDDLRGWSQRRRFRRAKPGETPSFTVVLASPSNVDRLCAPLRTDGTFSCGVRGIAVVNALRWRDGPVDSARPAWSGEPLGTYRTMVVNHEVGHVLGLGHADCPTPGAPASIMSQQTIGLKGCQPNPWPLDSDLAKLDRIERQPSPAATAPR